MNFVLKMMIFVEFCIKKDEFCVTKSSISI